MNAAYLSALSALGGSVIGGLASGITTWMSHRVQARAGLQAQDKQRREELYKEFIITASKVYADGFVHDEPQLPDLVALYGMLSRMRVLSSARVVEAAEAVIHAAGGAYFAPNRTVRELQELVASHQLDPLKTFSGIAREDLHENR